MDALLIEGIQQPQEITLVALSSTLVCQLCHVLEHLANLLPHQLRDLCLLALAFCLWHGGCLELLEEIWRIVVAVNFHCASIIVLMHGVFGLHVGILCSVLDDGLVDRYTVHGTPCP